MKLKFVQSLTEADAERGRRLLQLKEINHKIKTAVEKAGYKFKDDSDRGFYILPKFGYVARLEVNLLPENKYEVKISNALAETIEELTRTIEGDSFNKVFEEEVVPGALNLIFKITPEDEKRLNSGINEALPKWLKDAIGAVRNKAQDIKNAPAERAAKRHDKKDDKALVKQIVNIVKNEADKMSRKLSVKHEVKDSKIIIEISSDVIAGVVYKEDNLSRGNKRFYVSKCITSVSEVNLNTSLASFISFMNRKLHLNINLDDGNLLKVTGSSEAEVRKVGSFEQKLKDVVGDDILSTLGENLLSEAQIKKDTKKYDEAIPLVQTAQQGEGLVKLYFYRESGNKLELNDNQARALWKEVFRVKSFAKDSSAILFVFVNYYNKNQGSKNIEEELKNLIILLTTDNFSEKLGKLNTRISLIFNRAFVGTPAATKDKQTIYERYHIILKKKDLIIDNNEKKTKLQKELKVPVPNLSRLATINDIANFMIFTDNQNKTGLRELTEVLSIYNALIDFTSSKNVKKQGNKKEPEVANKEAEKKELMELEAEEIKILKDIFDLSETGSLAATELRNKINADTKKANTLKKIFKQLSTSMG